MSENAYTLIDLPAISPQVPQDSIISRQVYRDAQINVTLFVFAAGQELTEHTAAFPAMLHFLEGEGELTLGEDTVAIKPGLWVHMPAHLPHSLTARTRVAMLLTLLHS
jgi:quercetin dioxygenase-like cupin family protein